MVKLSEKIGYGFGDMASSMFWKVFIFYLPFFYSNIFGLKMADAALLMLVTKLWDGVSDPMMGILADRTKTKWGKYRPYLLWVAAPFSICGILLFTTPDWGYAGKLIWAYVTYVLMMTVYTGINVPYGAMLGVMSDNPKDKTVFSSYRMFFAYGGSFIAVYSWEPLCEMFNKHLGISLQSSWQAAMCVVALACFILFLCCFKLTKERLKTVSVVSIRKDFKALMSNKPWWLLIGATLSFNLFGTVRGTTVAYFFADVIGDGAHISIFAITFLFFSGLFLSVGEVANMVGVALTVPITSKLGKKNTFMLVSLALIVPSIAFFFVPVTPGGFWVMLLLQILISVLYGIISPLVWSMYADVSDYAELKYRTASTGLIFSSSSMAQKFGGAIGSAAVLWVLDAFGYVPDAASQSGEAISCLWVLMSWAPAATALLAFLIVWFYPLTTRKMDAIVTDLKKFRLEPVEAPAEDFANTNG